MSEILRRLGIDTAGQEERPLISEDFVFDPAAYASGRELGVAHEEVYLEETPLALLRQIHLQHAMRGHASLTLRLALCWNGFRDALQLVSRFSLSFQRAIPVDAVVNTAEKYGAGDLGIAWPWSGKGDPDVLAFVRNNLFVSIQGHDAAAIVVPLARELDESLRKLRTGGAYGEDSAGLLAEVRRRIGERPRLPAGGRLDFGVLEAGEGSTLFFLPTSGSVNRAPERADSWYYRAGAEKGRQEVVLAPASPVFCNGSAEQYKNFWIVNCYDCAASSALMAKAVGADSDYYFHVPFGYLKYVEPIGRGKCNNPFYGCLGNNPAVGPDDQRTRFGNHAYQKLNGSRNYDACMREWLSPLAKLILMLIWLIILIVTLGLVNLESLLNRAGGWLVDLDQAEYNTRTIDTSQPFEANAAAGGTQTFQTLQFSIT